MLFSEIPPDQLADWDDDELSGAIWDEAHKLLGGYDYTPDQVAALPFGYRAIVAEGALRAEIEGDGIVTTVWNNDGTAMFALAADCLAQAGAADFAALLREIDALHRAWQAETGQTPRDLAYADWRTSAHAQALDAHQERLEEECLPALDALMAYLRADPHCRTRA